MASANLRSLPAGDSFHDSSTGSRLFVDNTFRLAPKQTFLFHVFFNINPALAAFSVNNQIEVGMMVKGVDLPKFNIETKPMNSYNRWNLVQNKIKYDPIIIRLHDDSADVVRDFWYSYYSYYYRDSDYDTALYQVPYKYGAMPAQSWGYSPVNNQTLPFLTSISVYSMYQGQFTEYYLVNPIIENWEHGEHSQGENNTLTNTMRIAYEAIHYRTGEVSANTVSGFDVIHYDDRPSPIDPPVDTSHVVQDLNSNGLDASIYIGLNGSSRITTNLDAFASGTVKQLTNGVVSTGLNAVNSTLSKFAFPTLGGLANSVTGLFGNSSTANMTAATQNQYSQLSALTGPDSFNNSSVTSNNYGVGSNSGTYNFNMNDVSGDSSSTNYPFSI